MLNNIVEVTRHTLLSASIVLFSLFCIFLTAAVHADDFYDEGGIFKSSDFNIRVRDDSRVAVERKDIVIFYEPEFSIFDLVLNTKVLNSSKHFVKLDYVSIKAFIDGEPAKVTMKHNPNSKFATLRIENAADTDECWGVGKHTFNVSYIIEGAPDFCDRDVVLNPHAAYVNLVIDPSRPIANFRIKKFSTQISWPAGFFADSICKNTVTSVKHNGRRGGGLAMPKYALVSSLRRNSLINPLQSSTFDW